MVAIFGALFPIFAMIAIGYGCGKRQWFGPDADRALNLYVANLALPILTFHVLASVHGPDLIEPVMALVVIGSSYVMFAAHYFYERWRKLPREQANAAAFGVAYGNNAFIGLPVCLAILGPTSLAPAAVVMALHSAFIFGAGTLTSVLTAPALADDPQRAEQRGVALALRMVARNPLVIAACLGVLLAFSGQSLPEPVDQLFAMIGATTAPCALIAVGLFMARPVPKAGGEGAARATVRALVGKLLLMPLITAAMLWMLPPLPEVWHNTALIMAAVPAGAGCFALAIYGGENALRIAARIIALSTVLAGVSLPILLLLIGKGG